MDPDPSSAAGKGFFSSLIPNAARQHYQALQQSLEPDPNADELTRIDQEWIKQATTLTGIDQFGMMQAPSIPVLLALLAGVSAAIAGLLITSRNNGGTFCFVVFLALFFLLPLLLALFQTRKFFAAANAYRRRRAAALAASGRTDDRPLPVIERPVWVGAGMQDPRVALERLDSAYRAGRIKAAKYQQIRDIYLAHAEAAEQAAADDQWGGSEWQRRW